MNFNSHLILIQKEILNSLSKNKEQMVAEMLNITTRLSNLLKINCHDYIENRLRDIDWSEIPITTYALEEVKKRWKNISLNQKEFSRVTYLTLERLFTFWMKEDLCEMQGQFFYLKDNTTKKIFCESEFGEIRDFGNEQNFEDLTIASISDLKRNRIIDLKNENLLIK